jgi:membrane protein required for colicin V production
MNLLDILLAVFVVVGMIFGYAKGFALTASFVLGSFFGCWAANNYYHAPARFVPLLSEHPVFAYLLVFCAVFAAMLAAGLIINKIFKIIFLGWADKFAGAFLGIILSASIFGTLMVPLELMKKPFINSLVKNSIISKRIAQATKKAIKIFPPKKNKLFDKDIEQDIKELLHDTKVL